MADATRAWWLKLGGRARSALLRNRSVVIATLVVLLSAALAWGLLANGRGPDAVYQTAPITKGRLYEVVTATGVVTPSVSVDVSSQLSGRIAEVLVDFNEKVAAGQPIARLDQQSYLAEVSKAEAALEVAKSEIHSKTADISRAKSALASAEAEIEVFKAKTTRAEADARVAESNFNRSAALSRRGGASAEALDEARAGMERASAELQAAQAAEAVHLQTIASARAEVLRAEAELANAVAHVPQVEATLQAAKVNLDQTVIRSPIEGVVIKRDLANGQTVAASLEAPKLFTIAGDLSQMAVHARIDEADIGRIRVGQRATFKVDAFPNKVFQGEVVQVRKAPEVTQNVVTYTVVIAASNPDLALLPGMTALVEITVIETEELVLIPNAALRYAPEQAAAGTAVWVESVLGNPVAVPVQTGPSDATHTELVSGNLHPGQHVITGTAAARERSGSLGMRLGF